jgi:hypothetical protein
MAHCRLTTSKPVSWVFTRLSSCSPSATPGSFPNRFCFVYRFETVVRFSYHPLDMDRNQLTQQWGAAIDSGSFLTPKHDPNQLTFAWKSYRTVLSNEASASLDGFIKSGSYDVDQYSDKNYPKGSGIYVVTPGSGSPFTVAGSGVPSGSITPSGSMDRLVVVYDPNTGWHVYAEDSNRIQSGVAVGRWAFVTKY